VWWCRSFYSYDDDGVNPGVLVGTLPTELGTLTALTKLCVRCPHTPRLDTCAVTGLCAERGGDVWCRSLSSNDLTGTMPTELGTLTALTNLCVRCPHPSRLDACAVTGMWAECGVVLGRGCRGLRTNRFAGTLPTELGTLDTLESLCVHRPHPPRPDACSVTGLWAERGGDVWCRTLSSNDLTGTLPTELGTLTALNRLCVHRPHPPRPDVCAVTGLWAERGGDVWCRSLSSNDLTGTLPTELGTMDALYYLCVPRPHPPRLDACAATGLWAERGCGVGVQGAIQQRFHRAAADRAGHHGRADLPVRASPSPTVVAGLWVEGAQWTDSGVLDGGRVQTA